MILEENFHCSEWEEKNMIQAIIDIGSNTMRMAIYQIEKGEATMIMKKKVIAGLASYVKDGKMSQAGIERATDVLRDFRNYLMGLHIERVTSFTTAALRNATNSREAVAEIERRTGIPIRVITGDEEAQFDFYGAKRSLTEDEGVLVDIGGGSSEVVYYKDGEIAKKMSIELGSLALKTKYVTGIIPTPREVTEMRTAVKELLSSIKEFDGIKALNIVGLGGTFKGALSVYKALHPDDGIVRTIPATGLYEMIAHFAVDEILPEDDMVLLMKAEPDRRHTLFPGFVIAGAIAEHFNAQTITYNMSGVREGFLYKEVLPTL